MVKSILKILLLIFILVSFVFPQENEQIKKKSAELTKLKSEITSLENALKSKTEEEKKSYSAIQNLRQQNLLLNRVIKKLVAEEKNKEKSITSLTQKVNELNKSIDNLRSEYSSYVTWLYKQGRSSTLKYLLNATSINQALIRYKYLSYVTEKNGESLEKLEQQIAEYNEAKKQLKIELTERERLVNEKQNEQVKLAESRKEKETLIQELKEDQSELEKEIEKKRIAEVSIKKIIDRLNEEERKRRELLRTEKLKNKTVDAKLAFNYDKFENFSSLKGKLSWPIESGNISRSFGENKNRKLNTVTINYGIDIKTNLNSTVYSVAEGRVSAIDWIPGYGSIVIITHKGNYRTVYGHITDIEVSEGQEVKGGTIIGKVDQSLEGNIIHFEIWNERNYLNPTGWFVKK